MFGRWLHIFLFLVAFLFYFNGRVLAVFSPGETLNPGCSPFTTGCDIVPPVSIGSTCINGEILMHANSAWVCGKYNGTGGISVGGSNISLDTSAANTWIGAQTFAGGIVATENVNINEILTVSGASRLNGGLSVNGDFKSEGGGYFGASVGIGTSSPARDLEVWGDMGLTGTIFLGVGLSGTSGAAGQSLTSNGSGGLTWESKIGGSGSSGYISKFSGMGMAGNSVFYESGGYVGVGTTNTTYLLTMGAGGGYYNQTTGSWINGSDRIYKDKILDLTKYGLETVKKLRPVSYTIKQSGVEQVGFIAQELQKIVPEVVSGEDGLMGVNYGALIPILVKSIQEQQGQIDTNKAIINDLKDAIDTFHTNLRTTLNVNNLVVKGATTFESEVEFKNKFCMTKRDGAKVCVNGDQMEKLMNLVPTEVPKATETPIPTETPTETPMETPTPTPT